LVQSPILDNETDPIEEGSDTDEFESEEIDKHEDEINIRRGPGRPRLIRSGKIGRPRQEYNTLNLVSADKITIPKTVEEDLSGE